MIRALVLSALLALACPAFAQSVSQSGGDATTLNGKTFAAPAAIGSGTPAAGTFTGLTAPTLTTGSGDLVLSSTTGAVRVGSGSVPTIASGACGTGANGTIAAGSRSNAGTINIGAQATTVCTVVFASAMATAPICTIYPANATAIGALILAYVSSTTVNGFVITGAVLASTSFNYHCI